MASAKNWGLTLCNVITSSANKTTEHKVKMNRQQRACADQALLLTMCPQAAHSTSLSLKLLTCKKWEEKGDQLADTISTDYQEGLFLENICERKPSAAFKAEEVHLSASHSSIPRGQGHWQGLSPGALPSWAGGPETNSTGCWQVVRTGLMPCPLTLLS